MPSSNNVRKVTSENYPADAGREGELIFRLVYQQAGCKKPFSRLWLSSMEESAIREGFAHLKPSTEYDALYNAALCRERADWMVGMKKGANALMKSKIIGVCPNCGKPVVEREKGWFCENRECRFVLWKDNAFFKRLGKRLDAHVADKLLRDGRVRLKDCKSAKGKTYNATVLLSCEADGRSKFSLEFEGGC